MENFIREILKRTGMSQKELADKLYVTPQAVSKWVRGESRPSVDNVERIFEITGINIMEMTSTTRCSRKNMRTKSLKEIDDYSKAKQEADIILEATGIRANYSHAVYKLCTWLLPAVICLTHHQMLNRKDEEIEYDWIFTYLMGYFDDECMKKVEGLYENQLEYDFYLMGMDLFESFDEYTIPDDEYCREAMDDWYRFEKALVKDNSSPVYNELLVAITEIAELEE